MSGYLSRFKALKSEKPSYEVLSKPTKPPFGSFGSAPAEHFDGEAMITEPMSVTPQTKDKAMLPALINVAGEVKISEQRHDTVLDAINAIATNCVGEIIRGNKWHDCPESRAAEAEIGIIQKNIMEGRGSLIDYRDACEKWKKAGTD